MTEPLNMHLEPLRDARERAIAAEVERRAAVLTPILLMMLYGHPDPQNRD